MFQNEEVDDLIGTFLGDRSEGCDYFKHNNFVYELPTI